MVHEEAETIGVEFAAVPNHIAAGRRSAIEALGLGLTALVPSERACRQQGRRHKPLLEVGRQLALQARRWVPGRDLVPVGDGGFSALRFLDAMRRSHVTAITRLRLDAALYDPAPPRPPGTIGRPRTNGVRRPTLAQTLKLLSG